MCQLNDTDSRLLVRLKYSLWRLGGVKYSWDLLLMSKKEQVKQQDNNESEKQH